MYCIDTNAIIDLRRRNYPPDIFRSMWEKIENLIEQEMLIAPVQVYNELEPQRDEIVEWAKGYKDVMFKDLVESEQAIVRQILTQFPNLVDSEKMREDADPFLIVLAMSRKYSVITNEKVDSTKRIPHVCKSLNVKCLDVLGFF